jgi:phenylacetate-coenzyme A ligase PaaK-like adenylate-forming protein
MPLLLSLTRAHVISGTDTSGTTGQPKGVPIPVKALASFHMYMAAGMMPAAVNISTCTLFGRSQYCSCAVGTDARFLNAAHEANHR